MSDHPLPPSPALELFCARCGYSLHGLPRPVCPECGEDASPYLSDAAQLAWLRVSGWCHPFAFWKSVFQIALRDPGRLRFELVREIDYRHTRAFAWLAAFIGWLSLPLTALVHWSIVSTDIANPAVISDVLPYGMLALVVTLVWMLLLSGLHTYFFHPRSLPTAVQNRTLALSYMAAAPLALLPLVTLLAIACVFAIPARYDVIRILVTGALPVAAILLWYRRIVSFAQPLLRSTARAWGLALLWPAAAALLTLVLLVVLPLIGLYVAVAFVALKELV